LIRRRTLIIFDGLRKRTSSGRKVSMRSERPKACCPIETLVTWSQSSVQPAGQLSASSVAVRCGATFPFIRLASQPKKRGDFKGNTSGSLFTTVAG
jgi:hypothetical protein